MLFLVGRSTGRRRRIWSLSLVGVLCVVTLAATGASSEVLDPTPDAGEGDVQGQVDTLATGGPTPVPGRSDDAAPPVPDLQPGVDAAVRQARQAGATVHIAVRDRVTDTEWTNGAAAAEPVFAASLVKLVIADNLLTRERRGETPYPTAQDRRLIESMLAASDDTAADVLYTTYGGAAMIAEVAARYDLPSLRPTTQEPEWELSTISALHLVRWYDAFTSDAAPGEVDFLVAALERSPETARDGFNQYFGIRRALPGVPWPIKQGWMNGVRGSAYLHTSGLVGPDNRYAVAILVTIPGDGYPIELLDALARSVLPPEVVDPTT